VVVRAAGVFGVAEDTEDSQLAWLGVVTRMKEKRETDGQLKARRETPKQPLNYRA